MTTLAEKSTTPTVNVMCSGAHSKLCQPSEQCLSGDPTPWGFDLWEHLHREHGLILTESELQEIVRLARAIP